MATLTLVGIMTAVSILLVLYWKSILNGIKRRAQVLRLPTIPERAYPLIGHSYLFPKSTDEFFRFVISLGNKTMIEMKRKLNVLWLGPVPMVFIVHPDCAEVIMRSLKHMEKAFVYRFLHPWLGTGLLTAGGQKWHQRRRLITPTFHFNILQDFLEVMNEQSERMLTCIDAKVKSGQKVDLGKAVTLCALDIICDTAMGQTVNAQENEDALYVRSLYRISEIVQDRQKRPSLWWDFAFSKMKMGKEQEKVLSVLHGFTRSVIEKRMLTKDDKQISKRMAFLDVLIHAKTEEGESLSLSDIQEEVDTFMFEGHDTTAAAMTWCLYLLGRHPDVQRRVQNEIDKVLGERSALTMDDVKNLQYLEQVNKEALRLYPSVPMFGRITTEDAQLDGFNIPKGSQVVIPPFCIHRNPDVWEDPLKFDPDRFSKERSAGRHPYAYIPFSAGPRNCIGQKFAQMEEKVILAQLLRRYKVTCNKNEDDIRMDGDLILRPTTPLDFHLETRS